MNKYIITKDDEILVKKALEVLKMNFDDGIYNHTVGAAVRCKNGKIYVGVNCDGIHGSCAEYIAIGTAISAGERDFDAIVSVNENAVNCLVPPCGNCRQMLIKYCPEIMVILNDEKDKKVKVKICDLLPLAWQRVEA